jgi:hypothetical protein
VDVEINETSLAAFIDELQGMEKDADVMGAIGKYFRPNVLVERASKAISGLPKSWAEGGKRFVEQLHPVKGLQRGWRWASPVKNPRAMEGVKSDVLKAWGTEAPTRLKRTIFGGQSMKPIEMSSEELGRAGLLPGKAATLRHVQEMKELTNLLGKGDGVSEGAVRMVTPLIKTPSGPKGSMLQGSIGKGPGVWSRWFGGAGKEHLLRPEQRIRDIISSPGTTGEKVQAVAEQLSRAGWTGSSGVTKYMPVGSKSMIAGFGGMAVPSIVQAGKRGPVGPTGEGGVWERGLGEAGGTLGWIAGMPLGLLGSSGMWYGGQHGGQAVGRAIDRLRSGASVGQALTAPTPTEARQQLVNIARNYG